ncbi:MAG: SagB/ThcOx family dehydrogenase, partial [Bdellovibrio sp.]|nr:SagB/ThcOx family dehydrogenase [Bdellovibrio sp.]
FHNAPLAQKEVTDLLAPCLASTRDRMGVPSAGALYPIDAYVVCLKSVDMDAGIYYWRAGSQNLIFLRPLPENINLAKNYASEVSDHVSVVLFLVARVDAILEKYGLRSFRLLFLEAGHFSQSLWLLATALKIDFLIRDDFYDDEISRYLALNPRQQRTLTSIMLSGAAKRP